MKLNCLKSDLEKALSAIQKVVQKNPNLPILENALFEARGDELFIKATNIELFIEYKLTVSIDSDGEFAIPVDILLNSIRNSKTQKKLELELKGTVLHVTDESGNFTIKTVPHEDFPKIKKPESLKEKKEKINKELILNGVRSVYSYASNMTIKPELASVYIYTDADDLVFVATDQFRLAEKRIKSTPNTKFENILIPIKNVNNLVKVLETVDDEDFKFVSEENQLSLESENIFVSSRVLDLSFPDYKSIIPKDFAIKLVFLKEDFVSILKKTAMFTDNFGKTELEYKNGKLKISTENKDIGKIEEYLDVQSESKNLKEFKVNVNNRYLRESVIPINSDSVELWFVDTGAPLLIKAVADNSFTYILMPMNN